MKHRICIFVLYLAISTLGIKSQTKKINAFNEVVPDTYNFWLYNPYDNQNLENEPKPVIIFLHGASSCGKNLDKVKRYGTLDAIEKGRDIDAYVIAPQNPGGSWNPDKIMNILDWVGKEHNIDYDKVYVIGMSLGGYGTIDLVAKYYDSIAAAIALCGGSTTTNFSALNEVPLWIIHGTADQTISIQNSDKIVAAMKKANSMTPRLKYDRVPGMNHSHLACLFYLPETYEWLLKHTLKDNQREISPTFELTTDIQQRAYSGLNSINRDN